MQLVLTQVKLAQLGGMMTMLTENFLRGRRRDQLSDEELQVIEDSIAEVRQFPARKTILKAGDKPDFSVFLIEGFICRYMDANDGKRQLVALQIPGDFVDLHAFPLTYLDHDNATITRCTVGIVPHERLRMIQREMPHLTHMLWFSTLLDAAMHREWIFRMGRLNAIARLAHFLAETEHRLSAIGRVADGRFALPLVQIDFAEATGMTPIHLNRCVRDLRREKIADVRNGKVEILSKSELWRLGEFDPAYLF
jgi:CRP-like cAMP-binding protein